MCDLGAWVSGGLDGWMDKMVRGCHVQRRVQAKSKKVSTWLWGTQVLEDPEALADGMISREHGIWRDQSQRGPDLQARSEAGLCAGWLRKTVSQRAKPEAGHEAGNLRKKQWDYLESRNCKTHF